MTLHEYMESLRQKTVAVLGIGVSNTPLVQLLLRSGIRVTACDKRTKEQLGTLADELEQAGCTLRLGPDYLEGLHEDVIFRTPGLRPDVPQLAAAVANGSVLTSEMEEFFRVCPCPIIAVTGSDGKTTTTTIIAELLKAAGNTVWVGGNIGHPLLCDADRMRPQDYAVLELSSFQLMTMDRSPHIAVVTNLAPNHLDMHKDMAEYVAAKENIFRYQRPGDIAVFNQDNDITRQQALRAVGAVRLFSRRSEPEEGVFDAAAVAHYRDVIACCRKYGVEPFVTLHHFSSPKWLISKGGWEASTTPEDFAHYVRFIIGELGSELHYICTINEANMGIQVAAIAERYKRQMMAQMQAAQSGGNSADGSVQVGINLQKMMEGQKAAAAENLEVFGVEKVENFTSMRTREGDLLILKAHELAKKEIKALYPDIKVGLTLSLHDIQPQEDGMERAKKEWDEEFMHYLPYIKDDDFLGVQNYTRSLIGADGFQPRMVQSLHR